MAGDKDTSSQTFDFETMAIVVYVMQKHNITMGKDIFKMMSAADGKRGPDGFQHQFRHVKKRATEIAEEVAEGAGGTPIVKTKGKAAKVGTPAKDKSAKRGRKEKEIEEQVNEDEDDEEAPSKKPKGEVKEEVVEDFGMFAPLT